MELELSKLTGILKSKDRELDEFLKRSEAFQQEIERLQRIKFDNEGKIAMLASEIERQSKKYAAAQ